MSLMVKCPVIKINGVEDHIHVLLSLSRTIAVSKLIAEIKSNFSRWIKTKDRQFCEFSWQGGYGAFSVSRPQINGAIKYIEKQKEHHKTQTFKEEYLTIMCDNLQGLYEGLDRKSARMTSKVNFGLRGFFEQSYFPTNTAKQ